MKNIPAFDVPTQVMFWDITMDHYTYGIAYKNEIICGCCGGVFEIAEIVDYTPSELQPIYPYENWVNLTDEIFGGSYPAEYEPQDKED